MNPATGIFPAVRHPQVVLVHADTRTGIVLDLDGNRYHGRGQKYRVFASLDEALVYATRITAERTEIECVIYDENKAMLRFVRPRWVTE
jgi:hypothetical protein